ncbi:hypothetical protein GGR51DRAFT_503670 [Neofusicoccum parvum]|nr:hypothetical protein GGR51DRAFT_503670 [Neofusicoccum parvum]
MAKFSFSLLLVLSALFSHTLAALLVDYNAARNDDPSKMGQLNLEAARGDKPDKNSADLYIKADTDFRGTKCAHFHRKKGDIRAEYHALNKKTEAGKTYFIGYSFALGATPDALMVWQWKEYVANADGGSAGIPLSLEVRDGQLRFEYQASADAGRAVQWKTPMKTDTVYTVGIEIKAAASGGYARLWWNGQPVTFATTKTATVSGNMFPGRSDPKFGAYRGEAVEVDTYVYQVQIGNKKSELDDKFF